MKTFFTARLKLRHVLLCLISALILLILGSSIFRSAEASVLPHTVLPGDSTPTASVTVTPTAVISPTASTTPAITPTASVTATPNPSALPRFDHVVVVVEENKDYAEVIGQNTGAPYINGLAAQGMLFTNSHATSHPSQPNYLDLFSGSDQGVAGDACSSSTVYPAPDLGGQLITAGFSFAGYSESQPSAGFTGCYDTFPPLNVYARKHNPWANFSDVSGPTTNLPFTSFPTTSAGFAKLPTVSFVIPNLQNDMHDGSIQQGDTWLQQNMSAYITWAKTNNSLLMLTWDEEDEGNGVEANPNQVATIFVGQHVQVGTNNTNISHYSILRTLEDMYGLPPANNAATATAITGVWN